MIVTLTPNPAVDITYGVASVTLGASHRVSSVHERAGGKGLNVAAVLTTMGHSAVAVAPVGSGQRRFFEVDLRRRGIGYRLVESASPTRRSIAVVDSAGEATLFNEAGSPQFEEVWESVEDVLSSLCRPGSVLTISGSLPSEAPVDTIAHLVEHGHRLGLHVIVDVGGAPLASALAHRPTLVKPNRSEAEAALGSVRGFGEEAVGGAGEAVGGAGEAVGALARGLVEAGAQSAIVSDGAAGVCLVHNEVALKARLREPLTGNPTGAGDALTAALAAELEERGGLPTGRDEWADALRRGVAWSSAAVLQPVAGTVGPDDVARLTPAVEVEEIPI